MKPARALLLGAALLALATGGCSFLLGVSEDPVADLVDGAADADDEDAAPE